MSDGDVIYHTSMGSALARTGQSGMDSANEIRLRPARFSKSYSTFNAYHFVK